MSNTLIPLHNQTSAPARAKPTLDAVRDGNGFIPNMFKALSNSPSTLNGFAAFVAANDGGTLSPIERQIVQLSASIENKGAYCVAGHSAFAEKMGLAREPIEALREGRPLGDPRQQALADFTRAMTRKRGRISDQDMTAFRNAGFREEQVLEVIAGVALKTVTNYVSNAFRLPLDDEFKAQAWNVAHQARPAA